MKRAREATRLSDDHDFDQSVPVAGMSFRHDE
jgi:hypothetical protein